MDLRDLSPLFEPFAIKGLEFRNRFVLPGMQRYLCEGGNPLPPMKDFYRDRVRDGVALVITEACAVDHPSATQSPTHAWITEKTRKGWSECVDVIHEEGGKIFIQLWHEGAFRTEGGDGPYADQPTISPSGLYGPGKARGRAATLEELDDIKQAFVRSALIAQEMGADGVEIHASAGYLLDQFIWPVTNQRTDHYNGDLHARLRFPTEVIRAVRKAVGPDFVMSVCFAQWKRETFDAKGLAQSPEEYAQVLAAFADAGIDVFQPATRRFWEPEWPEADLALAGWAKRLSNKPVVAVGSVGLDANFLETRQGKEAKSTGAKGMEEVMRRFHDKEFDMISVGRAHLSDPRWVYKVRNGLYDDIVPYDSSLGHR